MLRVWFSISFLPRQTVQSILHAETAALLEEHPSFAEVSAVADPVDQLCRKDLGFTNALGGSPVCCRAH